MKDYRTHRSGCVNGFWGTRLSDKRCLKPNVSLFGEGINGFVETRDHIMESDTLIVAGASLRVGPFNELPLLAQFSSTVRTVWVNKTPSPEDYVFDEIFEGGVLDWVASQR